MKRKFRSIQVLLKEARDYYGIKDSGLCALYDIENMGFCKDGVTRWYHLTDLNGDSVYTLKR